MRLAQVAVEKTAGVVLQFTQDLARQAVFLVALQQQQWLLPRCLACRLALPVKSATQLVKLNVTLRQSLARGVKARLLQLALILLAAAVAILCHRVVRGIMLCVETVVMLVLQLVEQQELPRLLL
jgi:hypothetical protein